ncbi:hypothetical protein [Salinirubrum litoreum]|uniref:Uncharacterized protein n=1 Tax=Salinirubrum litoreum TaxID=1126234 RepID=A0ABD5RGS7_9EURY|nr:hypothetical protein [Salinirubrum litoreum]
MHTDSPESRARGSERTATAAAVAVSNARTGDDVPATDTGTRNWSRTPLIYPDSDRVSSAVESPVRRLVGRPRTEFDDLTRPLEREAGLKTPEVTA